MFFTAGEKLFGTVDRVPGRFYVATPFLFFCEFPIFPGRSYLVLEGSRVDPTLLRKGSFSGYSVYWSLKSIVMAWFRALLALLSIVAVITAVVEFLGYFSYKGSPGDLHAGLIASGALVVFLVAYLLSLRLTIASRRRLTAMVQRLEKKHPQAALVIQKYLKETEQDSLISDGDSD